MTLSKLANIVTHLSSPQSKYAHFIFACLRYTGKIHAYGTGTPGLVVTRLTLVNFFFGILGLFLTVNFYIHTHTLKFCQQKATEHFHYCL